jgi:hypothetical protein
MMRLGRHHLLDPPPLGWMEGDHAHQTFPAPGV